LSVSNFEILFNINLLSFELKSETSHNGKKSILTQEISSFHSYRLYCYAQKHVRSIKAITKDPTEITEKRYRSIRRLNKPNKKLKIKNFHHSSPYHVSDHKAAITVGVIMGVFLGMCIILVRIHQNTNITFFSVLFFHVR
jgi:hypothetical protein